jgi:phage head maturation protease
VVERVVRGSLLLCSFCFKQQQQQQQQQQQKNKKKKKKKEEGEDRKTSQKNVPLLLCGA